MAKSNSFKAIGDKLQTFEWDWIKLSSKDGYVGAIKCFTEDNLAEAVAVGFSTTEAFIVKDDAGLFLLDDLKDGIFLEPTIRLDRLAVVDGFESIAFIDEDTSEGELVGKVVFDEDALKELGFDTPANRKSITERLLVLNLLNEERPEKN